MDSRYSYPVQREKTTERHHQEIRDTKTEERPKRDRRDGREGRDGQHGRGEGRDNREGRGDGRERSLLLSFAWCMDLTLRYYKSAKVYLFSGQKVLCLLVLDPDFCKRI